MFCIFYVSHSVTAHPVGWLTAFIARAAVKGDCCLTKVVKMPNEMYVSHKSSYAAIRVKAKKLLQKHPYVWAH